MIKQISHKQYVVLRFVYLVLLVNHKYIILQEHIDLREYATTIFLDSHKMVVISNISFLENIVYIKFFSMSVLPLGPSLLYRPISPWYQ